MCTGKPKNVQLPNQNSICDSDNSACTYAELKTGFSKWGKRMTVMTRMNGEPPKLIIYTYFLQGLGAGLGGTEPVQDLDPQIGQIIFLDKLETCETKKEKNGFIVKLKSEKGEKVTLKFTGKDSAQWTSAILTGDFNNLMHNTHRPPEKKIVKDMTAELKDKSDEAKENQSEKKKKQTSASPKSKKSEKDKKKETSKKPKSNTESQKNVKKTQSKTGSEKQAEPKQLTLADTQTFEMEPEQFGETHKENTKSEKGKKTLETATSSGKRQNKKEGAEKP